MPDRIDGVRYYRLSDTSPPNETVDLGVFSWDVSMDQPFVDLARRWLQIERGVTPTHIGGADNTPYSLRERWIAATLPEQPKPFYMNIVLIGTSVYVNGALWVHGDAL